MVLNLQYLEAFSILPAIWPLAYPPKTSERSQSGDLQSWLYSVKKDWFVKKMVRVEAGLSKVVCGKVILCKSGFMQELVGVKVGFGKQMLGVKKRLC